MPDFNPTATGYCPANASMLAKLSKLAYDAPSRITAGCRCYGFPDVTFLGLTATRSTAFICMSDKVAVVVFRGTADIQDVFVDIDAKFTAGPFGKVHAGFLADLDTVWPDVVCALSYPLRGGRMIWLTGHSLGAAMATLAAAKLMFYVGGLYTYGSPRCGNAEFARGFNAAVPIARVFRHVYENDIVTRVPNGVGFRYRHVGHEVHLHADRSPHTCRHGLAGFWDDAKAWVKDATASELGIADHHVSRYVDALATSPKCSGVNQSEFLVPLTKG